MTFLQVVCTYDGPNNPNPSAAPSGVQFQGKEQAIQPVAISGEVVPSHPDPSDSQTQTETQTEFLSDVMKGAGTSIL